MTKPLRLPKKHTLLLLALFIVHGIVAQTIRYVNASLTTGSNNGTSWANAYNDLQPALTAAQNGDQVWVARGTYFPTTSTTDRTASFVMKINVGIYGGFAGTETGLIQRDLKNNVTTLSGDIDHVTDPLVVTGTGNTLSIAGNNGNSYSVVNNNNNGLYNRAVLDGFTITAGNANSSYPGSGGGMYNYTSSPALANLTFVGNSGNYGAGMLFINYSSPILTNVVFLNNLVIYTGGGMTCTGYSSPSLTNVKFTGNDARINGGGMLSADNSYPNLTNVVFFQDNASSNGGGMYNDHSSPIFTSCIFSQNTANLGGGMMNSYYSPSLINCVFYSNNAVYGGALYNYYSSPILVNVVVSENSSIYGGAGAYNYYSTLSLQNSIVWANSDGIVNQNSTSTISYSDLQGGYAGTGNISQDPQFVNVFFGQGADLIWGTADDGLELKSTSPCINTGNSAVVPPGVTTDVAGLPRIVGVTVDMGAYETQTSVLPLQLLNFSGLRQGSNNLLQWTTANETGTKNFMVESGIVGNSFTTIGNVAATGSGKYSYTDINPFTTPTYYRLKMIDADGRFTYSDIIWINTTTNNYISVYPNPVTQTTTLNIGNNTDLIGTKAKLMDANGRVVKVFTIAQGQEQLDMGFLPTGLYVLKLNGNEMKILKL